ncbi:MAG: hypothetical protein KDD69_17700 [Bdellovibrionales bacterium]|nr:hypothetical protein [Bdellovibrionales bacterium]
MSNQAVASGNTEDVGAKSGRLLTVPESAELAGVSRETLEQYQSFGLLEMVDNNGTPSYRESDIRTLFYTRADRRRLANTESSAGTELSGPAQSPRSSESTAYAQVIHDSRAAIHDSRAAVQASETAASPAPTSAGSLSQAAGPVSATGVDVAATGVDVAATGAESTTTGSEAARSAFTNRQEVDGRQESKPYTPLREQLEVRFEGNVERWGEVEEQPKQKAPGIDQEDSTGFHARVPAIVHQELIEINKGLRAQLDMVKEERDWLRQRIEKLEARSEREQMLLLSESETVRSLIEPQRRRDSFWRKAVLPFFGFERK